jgi:hypothetical protein
MGTAINPLCASCRRAKALGYARRSPPARVITDSFFKVHQPSAIQGKARLRGRESCALLQERERRHLRCARLQRAPRQRRASPTGASTRSGRASLARTNGVTPDDGQCRMSSLTDQHARRSPRGERDGDGGRPRRFNLFENCYNPVCTLRLRAEALGYGMRSPPARAGADYFFKDHKPSVPVRRIARGARFQQSVDRNLFRSPRGAYNSQECSTLSNRFNLFENCYNPVCALRLRAGGRERDACPPVWIASLHAGETPAPPGGAGTRPVVARQEHARTTVGCPGRQAS